MLREVEGRVFKDADQVAETFDSGRPFAQFVCVIEVDELSDTVLRVMKLG